MQSLLQPRPIADTERTLKLARDTLNIEAEAVTALDDFHLAGLSPVVTIGGSLIAALALLEGHASRDAIWAAVETDEDWQTENWGDDDIAIKARETRKADFDAGARFLSLL